MTEPNDDDYVSIEEDYAEYDREWFEETGAYRYEDHELWPEIHANGWRVGNNISPPSLEKGVRSGTGNYSTTMGTPHQMQWIIPPYDYRVRTQWVHVVEDSHTYAAGIHHALLKQYDTLGDALKGARTAEKGKGYQNYTTTEKDIKDY